MLGIEEIQQRTVLNFHHFSYQLPQIWPVLNSFVVVFVTFLCHLLVICCKAIQFAQKYLHNLASNTVC